MLGSAQALIAHPSIELIVAAPSQLVQSLTEIQGQYIRYYVFPLGKGNHKYNNEYRSYWREIKEKTHPDIVHIHGTEFSHGLSYIEECGVDNVVVSIQGLVSVYARYYNYGLSNYDIFKNLTLRDLIRGSLFSQRRAFERRGEYEIQLLKNVRHIIGRTSWDKGHIWAINPKANYHFCNETLRSEFYSGQWTYEKCIPHTIFISQISYPIKGFHQILKALPYILRHFPDTQLRVAGGNLTDTNSFRRRLLLSGYGKYLKYLIKLHELEKHIEFLGYLDAEQMKQEYLRANVFVCPSSIENSPNSLGEAQLLGVPIIASYVGGIPDMIKDDECHMYRFEEVEMLAMMVSRLFSENSIDTSKLQEEAKERHDPQINADILIGIYEHILDGN